MITYSVVASFFAFSAVKASGADTGGSAGPVFDRVSERAKVLEQLSHPPVQSFAVVNSEVMSPEAKKFMEYFQKEIWPTLEKLSLLDFQSGVSHVAVDRALFNDISEKKQWQKITMDADKESQSIFTSDSWKRNVKNWAGLSSGLNGDLASFARRLSDDMELSSFSEKELPLLNRLTEISVKLSDISNGSPFVAGLAANEKAANDIVENYFSSQISFNDAWKKLEGLIPESRGAMGQDVALRGSELFNEAAIIRTKLAQSKGYSTWADYKIAVQARHHKAPFNTVEGLIEFLKKILKDTRPAYKAFLKKQYDSIPGADFNNRRASQAGLVAVETDSLIRPYFPKENIESVWAETMIQSGFDPAKLETIVLDGYPRVGKYTHAYMSNASSHMPKTLAIDGSSLNVMKDAAQTRGWFSALIYIVQNYRDDGANAWTTAWHEGGHAMDYAHREDIFGNDAAYGYVETHSMTMEHFFEDVDFLVAVGKTRDGKQLTRELAEKYILNSRINALKNFRIQVSQALYDILLWKERYTEGGKVEFVKKANQLRTKLIKEASQMTPYTVGGVDPGYGGFSTNHFYSGNVRYFGYILSTVAAQMTANKLWDQMEKTTGRRTLYKQNGLAKILIDGYYKSGFLVPFPGSIESFTGKTYSPDDLVRHAVEVVKKYSPNTCTTALKGMTAK